jgi:4-hydroxythreonine-4-phosphate dehydrogenase
VKRHLAITMGDPAGIGPEIIVKACRALSAQLVSGALKLLIIGHATALEQASAAFAPELKIATVSAEDAWPALAFLPAGEERAPIQSGQLSPEAGRFAFLAIEQGVRLAQAGRVAALVTAPLNKEALNDAGYHYAGHTEMLAELTGRKGSVMMLAHGNMRVSHVTTHIALEDVPKRITPERIRLVLAKGGFLVGRILMSWRPPSPRPIRMGCMFPGPYPAILFLLNCAPANMMRWWPCITTRAISR